MSKKILVILLLMFSVMIFAEKVNIAALKGPTGLSMVKLIESNDSILNNSDIEYSIVNTPDLAIAGLLSGSYDIAALPTNLAAIIFNKKPDYQLAAVTGEGTLYIISSRKDISSWNDLKGKKVYNIARSSTPGFLFNHLLTENSIEQNSLDIDYTYNNIELAPLLIAGKVETGILPEPLITSVLLKNPNMKVVLDFQQEYRKYSGSSYPLSCIVVKKTLSESNPEFVKQFLNKLDASIAYVNQNPFEAGEKGKTVGLGVTGALIEKAQPRLNLGFKSAQDAKGELESYYSVLFNSDPKSVGGSLPAESFYLDLK